MDDIDFDELDKLAAEADVETGKSAIEVSDFESGDLAPIPASLRPQPSVRKSKNDTEEKPDKSKTTKPEEKESKKEDKPKSSKPSKPKRGVSLADVHDVAKPIRKKPASESKTSVLAKTKQARDGAVVKTDELRVEDDLDELDALIDAETKEKAEQISETLDDIVEKKKASGRVVVIEELSSEVGAIPFVAGAKVEKRPLGKTSLPEDSPETVGSTKRTYSGKNVVSPRLTPDDTEDEADTEPEVNSVKVLPRRRGVDRKQDVEKFAYDAESVKSAKTRSSSVRTERSRASTVGIWIAVILLVAVLGAAAGALVYLFFLY